MAEIKLKNTANTEFSISHNGTRGAKAVTSDQIVVAVETINDFPASPETGDTVIVKDNNRGGTFICDATQSAVNNGGTVFDGWVRQYSGAVNVKWFGAISDARLDDGTLNPSPTDNTPFIQNAIKYAALNNRKKVVSDSGSSYYTASKIYLITPYRNDLLNTDNEGLMIIDFNGAEFIGSGIDDESNAFMESGYVDSNGDIQSVIGTTNEYYLSAGYQVMNIKLRDYYIGFKVKGLVYGSKIANVFGNNVQQMINSNRCFYTHFEQLVCRGTYTIGLPRFKFVDNNNIMPLKGLVSGSCDIGYEFNGATEAQRLVDCGIEDFQTIGIKTTGQYNIKFDSCYFESGQGVGFTSAGGISATFDNCWVNGDFALIGSISDATRLTIKANTIFNGSARPYDSLPAYCFLNMEPIPVGKPSASLISLYSATPTANIKQKIPIYNPAVGFSSILGIVENTSKFHAQKVSGSIGIGFTEAAKSVGLIVTTDISDANNKKAIYTTNITDTATQLIYIAFKIANANGIYTWQGLLSGNDFYKITGAYANPTKSVVDGKIVITSPSVGTAIGVYSAEIRIL